VKFTEVQQISTMCTTKRAFSFYVESAATKVYAVERCGDKKYCVICLSSTFEHMVCDLRGVKTLTQSI